MEINLLFCSVLFCVTMTGFERKHVVEFDIASKQALVNRAHTHESVTNNLQMPVKNRI